MYLKCWIKLDAYFHLRLVHTMTATTTFLFAIAVTLWTPPPVATIPILSTITTGSRTYSIMTLNDGKKIIYFSLPPQCERVFNYWNTSFCLDTVNLHTCHFSRRLFLSQICNKYPFPHLEIYLIIWSKCK